MTTETMVFGALLVVSVVNVGISLSQWRSGGRRLAPSAAMGVAFCLSALTVGWVRYAAWAFLAVFGVMEGRRFFTDRSLPTLFIGLVFLPALFGIAVTEMLFDELSLMEKALFSVIAVLAAAAIVTVIVRLVQAGRARHA